MLIDCDGCAVRGLACRDCVVTVLLERSPQPVELDDAERNALAVLAEGGLVPPLRLVSTALLSVEEVRAEPGDVSDTDRSYRPYGRGRHAAG